MQGASDRVEFRRVLVTGGEGFVGRHLRTALAVALPQAAFSFTTRGAAPPADGRWHCLDITSATDIEKLVAALQPDLVLHLAAQSSVGSSSSSAAATWKTNVGGAIALATAIARHAPNATVLNVSSAEVYGASFRNGPATEQTPLQPMSVYGRTKAAAESAFADILLPSNRLITGRPFNHTGPGQDERFAAPSFAAQIARIDRGLQEPKILVGNLDAERDILDVRDVVRAYIGLIGNSGSLPMRTTFNIASGRATRIADVLDFLLKQSRTAIAIEPQPDRMRPSDIPRATGDASALQRAIGWQPAIELQQTLLDVLDNARQSDDKRPAVSQGR